LIEGLFFAKLFFITRYRKYYTRTINKCYENDDDVSKEDDVNKENDVSKEDDVSK
jgi:hypothetical protein